MSALLPPNRAGLIGFGELGIQLKLFLQEAGLKDFIHFDDHIELGIVGNFEFQEYDKKGLANEYYIGVGYKHLGFRQQIVKRLDELDFRYPNIVHSSSYIAHSVVLDGANYIYPKCNIDKGVRLGRGTVLNNGVIVSHDSEIGECCYVSPGAIICGKVTIGDGSFIGAGSIISNGVKVGKNVKTGLGTVVTKDIPDGSCVIGNPMKFVSKLDLV